MNANRERHLPRRARRWRYLTWRRAVLAGPAFSCLLLISASPAAAAARPTPGGIDDPVGTATWSGSVGEGTRADTPAFLEPDRPHSAGHPGDDQVNRRFLSHGVSGLGRLHLHRCRFRHPMVPAPGAPGHVGLRPPPRHLRCDRHGRQRRRDDCRLRRHRLGASAHEDHTRTVGDPVLTAATCSSCWGSWRLPSRWPGVLNRRSRGRPSRPCSPSL